MGSEARLKRLGLNHVPRERLMEALEKQLDELEREEAGRKARLQARAGEVEEILQNPWDARWLRPQIGPLAAERRSASGVPKEAQSVMTFEAAI